MTLKKIMWLGVLPLFAMTACTSLDDNSEWGNGDGNVKFTSYISGAQKRATGTNWNSGDRIGIFMTGHGAGLASASATNRQYIADAAGNLTAADAEQAIAFPESGAAQDFVAYYPYQTVSGTAVAVNVSDQADQAAIDLLYSDNAQNIASGTVNLGFSHELSQVVLNIQADATIPTTAGLSVEATNALTQGSFDLATGSLTTTASSTGAIAFNTNAAGTQAEAILLPTTDAAAITLRFTLGGQTVEKQLTVSTLDAGTSYSIPVRLGNSGGSIYVQFGSATINPWTTVTGGDINVDFNGGGTTPDPEPGPGTETTIFEETFGDGSDADSPVNDYTAYDNYGTLTFFNPYAENEGKANIRSTKTFDNHLWLPANKDNSLRISGINTEGYTNLTLTYDITANVYNDSEEISTNAIQVLWNGTALTVPDITLSRANGNFDSYTTITIEQGITASSDCTLEFFGAGSVNTLGFRIDNIKLVGTK